MEKDPEEKIDVEVTEQLLLQLEEDIKEISYQKEEKEKVFDEGFFKLKQERAEVGIESLKLKKILKDKNRQIKVNQMRTKELQRLVKKIPPSEH